MPSRAMRCFTSAIDSISLVAAIKEDLDLAMERARKEEDVAEICLKECLPEAVASVEEEASEAVVASEVAEVVASKIPLTIPAKPKAYI